MPEEKLEKSKDTSPEIVCVCEFCKSETKNPKIEINFSQKKMFYYCKHCKKTNSLLIGQNSLKYPRIKGM